jgi:hypothetical protein
MKNIYFSILAIISGALIAQENVQLSLGQGYANQVYYSLENGTVKTVALADWDLAFDASTRGSNIRFNTANGSSLYLYPKADKSAWSSIDTAGLSGWSQLVDSDTAWDQTAFEMHTSSALDVGWGMYNTITHAVNGDSIYIIEFADNTFKKFWIEKLASGTYTVIHSDLDHSNLDTLEVVKGDYTNRNFAYFSFADEDDKDLEPSNDSWDLLFTKYTTFLAPNMPYGVTGVLLNTNTSAEEVTNTLPAEATYSGSWNSKINTIGWEWKALNNFYQFEIVDSLSYFVETQHGDIYQIEFTSFTGSSTGDLSFNKTLKSSLSAFEISTSALNVFPNPVHQGQKLQIAGLQQNSNVQLFSSTGQLVLSALAIENQVEMSLSGLSTGMYLIQVTNGNQQMSKTLIVK